MNIILKSIISFVLLGLLSTIIFIWYLTYKKYPGGNVGMAPLLIILNSLLSLVTSLIALFIIKILAKKELSIIKSNFLFLIINIFILFFYFGSNPFIYYENEIYRNVNLWSYLSVFISLLIVNGILLIKKNIA